MAAKPGAWGGPGGRPLLVLKGGFERGGMGYVFLVREMCMGGA